MLKIMIEKRRKKIEKGVDQIKNTCYEKSLITIEESKIDQKIKPIIAQRKSIKTLEKIRTCLEIKSKKYRNDSD